VIKRVLVNVRLYSLRLPLAKVLITYTPRSFVFSVHSQAQKRLVSNSALKTLLPARGRKAQTRSFFFASKPKNNAYVRIIWVVEMSLMTDDNGRYGTIRMVDCPKQLQGSSAHLFNWHVFFSSNFNVNREKHIDVSEKLRLVFTCRQMIPIPTSLTYLMVFGKV